MSLPPNNNTKLILSVEDDDLTFHLIDMAIQDLQANFELRRAIDGETAVKFLHRESPFEDAPKPRLVLLNLNLPGITGHEVLARMREGDLLQDIPVVVFSSSNLNTERAKCLAMGARNYITKPMTFEAFVEALRMACSFAEVA